MGDVMLFRAPIFLMLLLGFAVSPTAKAAMEDDQPPPSYDADRDEYDFSWLDPEKKIYVVQNRKYTKKQRLEIALNGGLGIGEPYRDRNVFLPRAFFYFNESWGISFLSGFNYNRENETFKELKSVSSVVPTVRDIKNFYGGSVVWLPFYAKINMFNKIFYVDWHFEAGLGQANTEIDLNTNSLAQPRIDSSSHIYGSWGTGMKFFITRSFAARLDYLAVYYKAATGRGGAIGAEEETFDNHYLTLGLSYTF
jgi:outer membrane beta-barrel protein